MNESVEQPENSRAGAIIEQLKRARFRRGKFGLLALLIVICLVCVVLAVVKATMGFEVFFLMLLAFLYAFAPMICWSLSSLRLSWLRPAVRLAIACSSAALIAVTFWLVMLWRAGFSWRDFGEGLVATLIFWSLQITCIVAVRYTLFRQPRVRRRRD